MISLKEIWKGFEEDKPMFENWLDTYFGTVKQKWTFFLTVLGYIYTFW